MFPVLQTMRVQAAPPAAPGNIVYVTVAGGVDTQDGMSWETAMPGDRLQDAIDGASEGAQIWVAAGTYYPTEDIGGEADPADPRAKTFHLKNGVSVYGGFAGTESSLAERDLTIAANASILSGDLDRDDAADDVTANRDDNAYHVMTLRELDDTALLDGFTITGGQGADNVDGDLADVGAGMLIDHADPILSNLTISGNFTAFAGGGIANVNGGHPVLTDVVMERNEAERGGGLYNHASGIELDHVTIRENKATQSSGGGIYAGGAAGNVALTDSVVTGNHGIPSGGGMYFSDGTLAVTRVSFENNGASSGGGISIYSGDATFKDTAFIGNTASTGGGVSANTAVTMTNVVIAGNKAANGGGFIGSSSASTLTNVRISGNKATNLGGGIAINGIAPTLIHVTISGNDAAGRGGGIFQQGGGTTSVRNSIIWGNSSPDGPNLKGAALNFSIAHSLVEGSGGSGEGWNTDFGTDNGGNLDANPGFVDDQPAGNDPSSAGDYRLTDMSPAIDAGDDSVFTGDLSEITDLAGGPRKRYGAVDMGAYEWVDETAPVITGFTPEDGSEEVPVDVELELQFSEPVSAASGKTIKIWNADDVLAVSVDAEDAAVSGTSASIGLPADLEYGTDYYVTMDQGAFVDMSGNEVAAITDASAWTFSTVSGGTELAVTASDATGAGTNGKTKITVEGTLADGHRLVYKNYLHYTPILPAIGYVLIGYDDLPEDGIIEADDGDAIIVAELDAEGKVVMVGVATAVVVDTPSSPSPGAPTTPAAPEPASGAEILVNGKAENAGTMETEEVNGRQVTTIALDREKLEDKLVSEGQGAVVTIPASTGTEVVVGELNGQMVKTMEVHQAVLEIRTERGSYTLPAGQINIDAVSDQIGAEVALQDIKVQIEIAEPAADTVRVVENAAADGAFALVVPPLEFTVRAVHEDTVIEVSKFTAYVERRIAIPDGADPEKITTAVVVEPDGSVRHVPTKVEVVDGRYYAIVSSLTNSTYTVIWNPVEFSDAADHWAKDAVNNMGSRKIIEGVGGGLFEPGRIITRAEFAAVIVRALGLKQEQGASPFTDVKSSDWHGSVILTAHAYGLLNGHEDGTFRPDETITREQAMVILARAMALTNLKAALPGGTAGAVLEPFADAAEVSGWAADGIADSVRAGIVTGRSGAALAPKAFITRAEAAVMVERLLRESGLI